MNAALFVLPKKHPPPNVATIPLLFISLYTDEDVTVELAPALRRRGYIAQSAQETGNREISDEAQLEYATAQGLAILTYNSQDFIPLAATWFFAGRTHAGIVVSEQFSGRHFGELLRQTLRLLDNLTGDEIYNRIVYLQQFR